jgi:hypothetical protein
MAVVRGSLGHGGETEDAATFGRFRPAQGSGPGSQRQ